MDTKYIKVLLLEDSKGDMRLLEEFLAEESVRGTVFEITGAEYLEKALHLLDTSKFDVILSDLFLPDSEGLSTLAALCGRAPDTPVVVLTAFVNEETAIRSVHSGAQDYLVKKLITGEALARVIRYSIERKRVEMELRAAERRQRALLDAMDDLIVVLDADCRVVMSNLAFKNAARDVFEDQTTTGRILAGGAPVLPKKAFELCRQVFAEDRILTAEATHEWREKQGVLELKAIPISKRSRVERVVVVAKDITQRKRMEQIKDDFNAIVSHELRSPMTTILAGLAMVLESAPGQLGDIERKLLTVAYEDGLRLNRILLKFLEMSRTAAGRSRFERAEADIVKLAEDTILRFSVLAKGRGIALKGSYSAGRITAFVDSDEIMEVFTNLVSNALKFTEKGFIEIGVGEKGDFIECSVSDTGQGIAKRDQSQLFSRFRQFGPPVAGAEKGTGLGLFIAKEIIMRHDGNISVDSEPGKGTRFTFTLPRRAQAETAPGAAAHGTAGGSGR